MDLQLASRVGQTLYPAKLSQVHSFSINTREDSINTRGDGHGGSCYESRRLFSFIGFDRRTGWAVL